MAGFTGRRVEDGPLDIPDNDGAVLNAGGYTGGKTPIQDIFFIVYSNFKLGAQVLDIIVVKAEKAEHLIEVVGMGLAEFYFFLRARHYPLGLGVEPGAGDGIGVYLDDRLHDFGVVLNAVRRIFSVLFGIINNIFSIFPLVHFKYLF
jgi:hypothetical protein